uniref:Uncharacterized protein n=1 Tax=Tanacetum cinerariifolium TaxID=118510 RepID=A0A6L2LAP0_TANCI|nr:hypothetical protein [Tanacetum cinerariifolium]
MLYGRHGSVNPEMSILDKTGHQKKVKVEDPKIVATRERKARAATKKRENKKRGGDEEEGFRPKGTHAEEGVFSLDPSLYTSPNEIRPKCQLGLRVRSVGSVSKMGGLRYGRVQGGCGEDAQ